jgi:hypothetical protein
MFFIIKFPDIKSIKISLLILRRSLLAISLITKDKQYL